MRERVSGTPGKYDDESEAALHATEAEAVVLLVFNGRAGHGFSVSALASSPMGIAIAANGGGELARQLRAVADDLEKKTAPDGVTRGR